VPCDTKPPRHGARRLDLTRVPLAIGDGEGVQAEASERAIAAAV
jgi:hypothetical protein